MSTQAFSPRGKTSELDVTSSAHAAVQPSTDNYYTYQFVNAGSKICYIAFGIAAADASVTPAVPTNSTPGYGIPILSGEIVVYNLVPNAWISAICGGSDTTSLFVTPGEGL